MKKPLKLLLLPILLVFLFSSCSYSTHELKNRLIIQAIGVDTIENGQVQVTLQTLNTEMAGNPNSGADLGNVINSLTTEGSTVAEAIANAAKQVGKLPMLSQNRLIVFGRDTAKAGIQPYLDYFVRDAQNRATVYVAVSDTSAKDLVSAELGESVVAASSLEDILQAMQFNLNIVNQELYMLVNQVETDAADAYMPVLKAEQGEDGESKFKLQSVAVFDRDKMLYELQDEGVIALQILTNQVESGGAFSIYNTKYQSNMTLQIEKCRVRIRPLVENDQPVFDVRIRINADIAENQTERPFSVTEDYLNETKKSAEAYINNLITENTKQSFTKFQTDPFCLGMRFKRKQAKFYKTHIENWKEMLPNVKVRVNTEVEIERVGNGVENI